MAAERDSWLRHKVFGVKEGHFIVLAEIATEEEYLHV
jgi:hypothetical protein